MSQSTTIDVSKYIRHDDGGGHTFDNLSSLIHFALPADNREHALHLRTVFRRAIRLLECLPALEKCDTLRLEALALEVLVRSIKDAPRNLDIAFDHRHIVVFVQFLALSACDGKGRRLEQRVRDPDFDVSAEVEQPLVQRPCLLALAFLGLEVDVRLPEQLGHRQLRLCNTELEDRARAGKVLKLCLEFSVFDPSGRIGWVKLEVLFVECADTVKFPELYRTSVGATLNVGGKRTSNSS